MFDRQNLQYQKWEQGDGSTVSGSEQPLEAVLHQLQYLQTEVQLLQSIFIFDTLSPNFVNGHRGQKNIQVRSDPENGNLHSRFLLHQQTARAQVQGG